MSFGFVLFFLLTAPVSFDWFAEIGVPLQYIGKGLEFIGIHLGEVDFEEFAIHDHLGLRCVIGSL